MANNKLKKQIAQRLVGTRRKAISWADFEAAVAGAPKQRKDAIVAHLAAGSARLLGERVLDLVAASLYDAALQDADTMLADDTISAAELEQIL
jgi:hypothetical protein